MGQGKMLDAQAAKAANMVDEIAPLSRVMSRMAKMKLGQTMTSTRMRADVTTPALTASDEFRRRRHEQRLRQARLLEMRRC